MKNQFKEISTSELSNHLSNENFIVVDVRSADAYNGWCMQNEKRGGHIYGARSLPAKWVNYIDWIEIVRSKNITPDSNIVLYGYNEREIGCVAAMFVNSGYKHVMVYNGFINEWCENKSLPMQKLSRYKNLVSAKWVKQLVAGENADMEEGKKYVVCHAHYRNRGAYLSGHIPGAIDLDTLALESPETWNRRSPDELKKALEEHGITHDTTVVLYGKYQMPDNNDPFPGSAAGHIGAIRCAFIMMYAGVQDVRVLNGGYQSWKDAAYPVSVVDEPKTTVEDFGAYIPQKSELATDVPEAKEILNSPNANLVSVRSWSEFIGEVSGYNYIEKKGRIPGAVFGNCGTDAYHMENYRNLDHSCREYHEIEEIWASAGITPDKENAFYCGTGWRGSEAFYNAWLMGWPKVSVFDGGWFEWSNNAENPYEVGVPEEVEAEVNI